MAKVLVADYVNPGTTFLREGDIFRMVEMEVLSKPNKKGLQRFRFRPIPGKSWNVAVAPKITLLAAYQKRLVDAI